MHTNEKKADWIPLTKWREHFQYPSMGTMRNIVARRALNGAGEFLSMINGRFYVRLEKFNEWMEKQTVQGGYYAKPKSF